WRDWVVEALNADLPFDQFTIWQLAGDLLPDATVKQKIASAFNRNHMLNGEGGAIAEEQRWVNLFDRMDTTATTWLGLTMACAQCHDHKYDPITMRDYYSLLAAFNNVSENGVAGRQSSTMRVSAPFLEVATPEQKAIAVSHEKIVALLRAALDEKRKLWLARVLKDKQAPEAALRAIAFKSKSEKDRDAKFKEHFEKKVE